MRTASEPPINAELFVVEAKPARQQNISRKWNDETSSCACIIASVVCLKKKHKKNIRDGVYWWRNQLHSGHHRAKRKSALLAFLRVTTWTSLTRKNVGRANPHYTGNVHGGPHFTPGGFEEDNGNASSKHSGRRRRYVRARESTESKRRFDVAW